MLRMFLKTLPIYDMLHNKSWNSKQYDDVTLHTHNGIFTGCHIIFDIQIIWHPIYYVNFGYSIIFNEWYIILFSLYYRACKMYWLDLVVPMMTSQPLNHEPSTLTLMIMQFVCSIAIKVCPLIFSFWFDFVFCSACTPICVVLQATSCISLITNHYCLGGSSKRILNVLHGNSPFCSNTQFVWG